MRAASGIGRLTLAAASLLLGIPAPASAADAYPVKPIKLIVAFAAGGPTDIMARALAQRLTDQLGVSMFVENLPGGSGVPGTVAGARAVADGYALTFATTTNFAVLPNLRKNLPYDPRRSFVPVSQISTGPFFVVVNSAVPAKTLRELIDLAKNRPGTLNFGTPGIGTPHHLTLELFKMRAGVDIFHIPYNGASAMISDLVSGRVQMTVDVASTLLPNIESKALRPLAVAGRDRSPAMPDVPTTSEAGLPDFEVGAWNGVLAPANTPKEIVARLHREIGIALATPAMREAMAKLSVVPEASASPADFATHIDRELKRWNEVITKANIAVGD